MHLSVQISFSRWFVLLHCYLRGKQLLKDDRVQALQYRAYAPFAHCNSHPYSQVPSKQGGWESEHKVQNVLSLKSISKVL